VNKDFDELIEEFIALEFLSASIQDKEGMIQALQRAFQEASSQENSNHSGRLSQLNFSRLAQNLGTVARSYPIRIPPKFALIIRCLTMLEGLALQNDPNFHIVEQVRKQRRRLENKTERVVARHILLLSNDCFPPRKRIIQQLFHLRHLAIFCSTVEQEEYDGIDCGKWWSLPARKKKVPRIQ